MSKNEVHSAGPVEPLPSGPMARDVRLWAKTNNVDCPERGEIPPRVMALYRRAHG